MKDQKENNLPADWAQTAYNNIVENLPSTQAYTLAQSLKERVEAQKSLMADAKALLKASSAANKSLIGAIAAYFVSLLTDTAKLETFGRIEGKDLSAHEAYMGTIAKRVMAIACGVKVSEKTSFDTAIREAKLGHVFAASVDTPSFRGSVEIRANVEDKTGNLSAFCSTLYGTGKAAFERNKLGAAKGMEGLLVYGLTPEQAAQFAKLACGGFWFIEAKAVLDKAVAELANAGKVNQDGILVPALEVKEQKADEAKQNELKAPKPQAKAAKAGK
jgi:hypothetical protein